MIKSIKISNRQFDIGFILICAVIIASTAIWHDLFRDIASEQDSDYTGVYQALRLNDGLAQSMFDHTGYMYFVVLSGWFKFLGLFNLVPITKLSELPGPQTFEPIFASLVYAGRWLAILLATISAIVVYYILKFIVANRYSAAATTILFAYSPGLVRQSLFMHTELLSMVLLLSAVLLALHAGRSQPWWEYIFLILSALFATLAVMAKMQVIPLILALPILVIIINAGVMKHRISGHLAYPTPWIIALALIAAAISIPAHVMAWTQIFPALPERHNVGNSGYQFGILIYFLAAIMIYSRLDKRKYGEFFLAIGAISVGVATALYFNFIYHHENNVANIVNFINHMTAYASKTTSGQVLKTIAPSGLFYELLLKLEQASQTILYNNFLDFNIFANPHTFIYWSIALVTLYFLSTKNWRLSLVCGALIFTALGMELFSALRHTGVHYRYYSEIWVLLAFGVICQAAYSDQSLRDIVQFLPGRKFIVILSSAIFLYALVGSVDRAFTEVKWQSRSQSCGQAEGYMPDLVPHFCSEKFYKPS